MPKIFKIEYTEAVVVVIVVVVVVMNVSRLDKGYASTTISFCTALVVSQGN